MRVSNELGAGNPKAAAFSVVVVTSISFIISVVFAVIVLALRHVISYAFTSGEVVANAVSELCPLLALTLLLNGVQPVLSGPYVYYFLSLHHKATSKNLVQVTCFYVFSGCDIYYHAYKLSFIINTVIKKSDQ